MGRNFYALEKYVLEVKKIVCPEKPFAIGLRLGAQAAKSLSHPSTLLSFQKWLEEKNCYVFTINGFPYGNFHGERVKEQVYRPDRSTPDRLEYTSSSFSKFWKNFYNRGRRKCKYITRKLLKISFRWRNSKTCFPKSTYLCPGN